MIDSKDEMRALLRGALLGVVYSGLVVFYSWALLRTLEIGTVGISVDSFFGLIEFLMFKSAFWFVEIMIVVEFALTILYLKKFRKLDGKPKRILRIFLSPRLSRRSLPTASGSLLTRFIKG